MSHDVSAIEAAAATPDEQPVRHARIAIAERVNTKLSHFVMRGSSTGERLDRLNLVDDHLKAIVSAACVHYGCADDADTILGEVRQSLAESCNETGYQSETQDVADTKSADPSAGGMHNSPSGDGDVGSKRNPLTQMDPEGEDTDFTSQEGALAESEVQKTVDADTPIGSEETGENTSTFPDKNQADPVTSKWDIAD